ncbi:hypothetical protein Tco_1396793 [Tanacetum coccineum]
MKCPQHYLTKMQDVILFYNGLDIPTRQIQISRGVIPSKTAADVKIAIKEMDAYSQKWHNGKSRTRSTKTSNGLATIQAQLNNLGREIKKVNEKVYATQEQRKSFVPRTKAINGRYLEQIYGRISKKARRKLQLDQRDSSFNGCCHKEPRSINQNIGDSNRANKQGTTGKRIWKST